MFDTIRLALALLQVRCLVLSQTYVSLSNNGAPLLAISVNDSPKKVQVSVNERLKILINELGLSVRAFSAQLEVPDTNTRNYLDKGTKLNSEYLERIAHHFKQVNLVWLITGEGQPIVQPTNEKQNDGNPNANNFFGGQMAGKMRGKFNQQQHVNSTPELQDAVTKLAIAQKEIENLQAQLASANALLAAEKALVASKDDFITLLRASYNRPN